MANKVAMRQLKHGVRGRGAADAGAGAVYSGGHARCDAAAVEDLHPENNAALVHEEV